MRQSRRIFRLLVAEEFVEVFKEADNYYDGRPRQADKEENGKDMHRELQKCGHRTIVNPHDGKATAFAT